MQDRISVHTGANAMRELREFIESFAKSHRLGVQEIARAELLVEELLTNVMKYGLQDRAEGIAELTLSLDDATLTIEFADNGAPFDPFASLLEDLDRSADRPVGGLGLHILRGLSDQACYRRIGGRNVVVLTRRVTVENYPA